MPKINPKGFFSPIIIGVVLVIALVIGLVMYFLFFRNNQSIGITRQSTISGTIDFNGVAPTGATISIGEKKQNQNDFNIVIQNIPAQDGASWSWNQATSGQDYEIQAFLQVNGQNAAVSDIKSISAPALNQILRINTQDTGQTGQQAAATISGNFDLNGYIPNGSQIVLLSRRIGATQFDVISTTNAQDTGGWSWNGAVAGYTYEIQAKLQQGVQTIGQANVISVTAPAANEVLTINSTAIPPQFGATPQPSGQISNPNTNVTGGISGTINLGGVVPGNSSLLIVARPTGTTNFNIVVNGLPANTQTTWSWPGAVAGQSYDLQAVLTVNGNDYAISPTLTVTAPASNEVFNLNASANISAPSGQPAISCISANGNQWNANITMPFVSGANQYWLIISTPGVSSTQIFSSRFPAQNPAAQVQQSIQTGYVLTSGVNYVASYAYSANPTSTNIGDFSPWSSQNTIHCP